MKRKALLRWSVRWPLALEGVAILLLCSAGGALHANTATPAQQDAISQQSTSQQDSVAEAARKAREQKEQKKDPAKPAKVFTNDDLGSLKGTISVVGNAPAPEDQAGDKGADAATDTKTDTDKAGTAKTGDSPDAAKSPEKNDKADAAQSDAKGEAYWRGKFADARRRLADDAKELDVLQREFNLKQQQYYSDPSVAMEQQYSRSDLTKTQDEINAKKADVDADKQAISDLEDDLRKAGGDPGWASAP